MAVGFVCERAHCVRQDYERRLGTTALPVPVRTYDAADNMTAKVEPFKDDFSDGNYTGWAPYPTNGWSAANGYMQNTTAAGWSWYSRAQTDPSVDVQLSYRLDSGTQRMYVRPRQMNNANSDRVELVVYPTWMWLRQYVGGVMTDFGTWSNTSTAGSWYDLRVECDGANINVWKGPKGGTMDLVKQVSTCTVTTTDNLMFVTVDSQWSFDDIRVLSDSLSASTTLTYDNANELTSTTSDGATTSYTYDAYGRMTGKTWGSYAATYAYRYDDKLTAVTSNFPGEGNVTYEYGSDGKRRIRNDGTVTKYRWDDGWNVVQEEDSSGYPVRHFVGNTMGIVSSVICELRGATPSTGQFLYYYADSSRSIRVIRDASKNTSGSSEYDPFGVAINDSGMSSVSIRFAGYMWDAMEGSYYTPYRNYAPSNSRWLTRDPLGSVDGANQYWFLHNSPIGNDDQLGLCTKGTACADAYPKLADGRSGGIVCCNGEKVVCVWKGNFPNYVGNHKAERILSGCAKKHESMHMPSNKCEGKCGLSNAIFEGTEDEYRQDECNAWTDTVSCLTQRKSKCGKDTQCNEQLDLLIKNSEQRRHEFCKPKPILRIRGLL